MTPELFVWAWECSNTVTEVSVRLTQLGHWFASPKFVLAFAEALRDEGVGLKVIPRSDLPAFVAEREDIRNELAELFARYEAEVWGYVRPRRGKTD